MRIKLALLDQDNIYLERIVNLLSNKYPGEFQLYTYSEEQLAKKELEKIKVDVILVNEIFNVDKTDIKQQCEFGYLVESNGIENIRGEKAICKYQNIEKIYSDIKDIFSDNDIALEKKESNGVKTKIFWFTSFSGGTGTTSIAVAMAKKIAEQHRVCYLDFEYNGNPEIFFDGEGNSTLSDVVFALKSNRNNTNLKIENSLKKSSSGVYYFGKPNLILDFLEMNDEEKKELIDILCQYCQVEYIIIDLKFDFSKLNQIIWSIADRVVTVSDGSEIANDKFMRSYEAIYAMDSDEYDLGKLGVIYNKFSNKTSNVVSGIETKEYGGIRKFEHATSNQVIDEIMKMNIFGSFL